MQPLGPIRRVERAAVVLTPGTPKSSIVLPIASTAVSKGSVRDGKSSSEPSGSRNRAHPRDAGRRVDRLHRPQHEGEAMGGGLLGIADLFLR